MNVGESFGRACRRFESVGTVFALTAGARAKSNDPPDLAMKHKSNKIDSAEPPESRKSSVPRALLKVSEKGAAVAIGTAQELEGALNEAESHCTPQHPIAVSLQVHGHQLEIGLGRAHSFIRIRRHEPTRGPCFISMGESRGNRGVIFFSQGWRRTKVPERNLLPATTARQILRRFFETGLRSTDTDWEAL